MTQANMVDVYIIISILIIFTLVVVFFAYRYPKSIKWKWFDLLWTLFSLCTVGYTCYSFASKDAEETKKILSRESKKINEIIGNASFSLGCSPEFVKMSAASRSELEYECLYLKSINEKIEQSIASGNIFIEDIIIYKETDRELTFGSPICQGPIIEPLSPLTPLFENQSKICPPIYNPVTIDNLNVEISKAIEKIKEPIAVINNWKDTPLLGRIDIESLIKIIAYIFAVIFPLRVGKSIADITAQKETQKSTIKENNNEQLLSKIDLLRNKITSLTNKVNELESNTESLKHRISLIQITLIITGMLLLLNSIT